MVAASAPIISGEGMDEHAIGRVGIDANRQAAVARAMARTRGEDLPARDLAAERLRDGAERESRGHASSLPVGRSP